MSDALALAWPMGVEQLASSDAKVRHEAVAELQKRATPDDATLLLILFADPDPLVREIALRAMGERPATRGPTHWSPAEGSRRHVRAAVLKQFAEKPPTATTIGKIAEYASAEKDSDLVVHAVRVFRAGQGWDGAAGAAEFDDA